MKSYALVLVAIASCVATTSAAAQTTPSDARCLLVSNVYAKVATNAGAREAARLASLFYLGRLDGRLSTPQLEAAMLAQQKGLKPNDLEGVMKGCIRFMGQRSAALQALGRRLDRRRGR